MTTANIPRFVLARIFLEKPNSSIRIKPNTEYRHRQRDNGFFSIADYPSYRLHQLRCQGDGAAFICISAINLAVALLVHKKRFQYLYPLIPSFRIDEPVVQHEVCGDDHKSKFRCLAVTAKYCSWS